jgi:ornithine cyclodeaminase
MTLRVATDEDVRSLPAAAAVQAIREVLALRADLLAPPRIRAELGEFDFVFTAGRLPGGASGFRVYRAGRPAGDQFTAVWAPDGRLRGIVVGDELGARRTGALGGLAADVLARPEAATVGVVGSGAQAWTQLWAINAIRDLRSLTVFSPNREHREAFALGAATQFGLEARAADSAAEAVAGADIVVLATTSRSPVIEAGEVAPGTHVTSLGPKSADGHEVPLELVAQAAIVSCDSPAQAHAYPEPVFTGDRELVDLADLVRGSVPGREREDAITLYCSVGLAGTEVALAERVLELVGA